MAQELSLADYTNLQNLCEQMLDQIPLEAAFFSSNEAHFHLSGIVNKQTSFSAIQEYLPSQALSAAGTEKAIVSFVYISFRTPTSAPLNSQWTSVLALVVTLQSMTNFSPLVNINKSPIEVIVAHTLKRLNRESGGVNGPAKNLLGKILPSLPGAIVFKDGIIRKYQLIKLLVAINLLKKSAQNSYPPRTTLIQLNQILPVPFGNTHPLNKQPHFQPLHPIIHLLEGP
ncbi:hypothetical protein J437_LFUL001211 [Ladona fulva]|uniref:Uncharacterized protein n=1 Tax=Ladona fulva TaxID=123851 RepID=A0A8K0JW91_LADFU|nr:hypothetical protein J437_LFUL001211 [Ladona fulva]